MKNLIAAASAIALFVASARTEDMRTIDGQIFVRTQGAETIKLSLVDVQLFDAKVIAEHLEKRRKTAAPVYEALLPFEKEAERVQKEKENAEEAARLNSIRGGENWKAAEEAFSASIKATSLASQAAYKIRYMAGYPHSALYYFTDLPKPLQTTKTDADGKFNFKVPRGSYVLAAASMRQAGGEFAFEYYNWMIFVIADADKKVMLANDNLSTSGSPDSLISTTEVGIDFINAMEGENLASLEAFIEAKKAEQRHAEARQQEERRQENLVLYRQNPKAAKQKAVALYPDLAVAGSPLNKEFVMRMKRYQTEKKEFFADPDWPIRLAKECADELAAKPPAK